MKATLFRITVATIAIASAACSDRSGTLKAKHPYSAPHGGAIVRLGKEEYHLEFVRDAAAGKLTAYVLDAVAKDPVRTRAPSFELTATVGSEKRPLDFQSVPNLAAGESRGDASRFEAHADWLKTTPAFAAELTSLKIRNLTFLHTPFNFPQGNERR